MSAQKESFLLGAAKDVVAGTAGGIGICVVGHPLDTVKVRLQTQPSGNPLYTGMFDCIRKTLAQEGVSGLYKGVSSPLIGQMAFNAVQFLMYTQCKALLADDKGEMTLPRYFAAGALVGLGVSFVESPIDLFKSQLQVQVLKTKPGEKPMYKGLADCSKDIVKNYGIRGFYQGLGPTILRDIPAVSLYFGAYEFARATLAGSTRSVNDLSTAEMIFSGGCGGIAYWILIFPLDVVKSNIQSDSPNPAHRTFSGVIDCATKLYRSQGMKVFYQGFAPCLLRAAPANAACFVCYNKTRELLG